MKFRLGHVTNSSSSSFIIRNKSDQFLSSEDVVLSWIARVLDDAKGKFNIEPGGFICLECGDHINDDGPFETFIHNVASYYSNFGDGKVSIDFLESHH